MFLTNSNNNNCDFSSYNSNTQLTNNATGGGSDGNRFSFPTSILENLLQNSDLLETLMKPISGDNDEFFIDEKMSKCLNLIYDFNIKKNKILSGQKIGGK